jgi:hypothetical protein
MSISDVKSIERIKNLRRAADAIAGFHAEYDAKYRNDRNCDKKGYGFSQDDRFRAFSIRTGFDSWRGYYGNSSCGRILLVDSEIAEKFFIKAIDIRQRELFETAARLMREEAAKLTAAAAEELAAMQAMLDEAKADALPEAAE